MTSSWKDCRLSEVAEISYGYTDSATFQPVGPKFLRITDIRDDSVDWEAVPHCHIDDSGLAKFRLEHGDIVFARTGATTGKSHLVQFPPIAVFASYLIRVRLTTDDLTQEFLSTFFQSDEYWSAIESGSSGSAQGGFNASKLGKLSIRFPGLADQRRIVAILDDVFDATSKERRNTHRVLKCMQKVLAAARRSAFAAMSVEYRLSRLGSCCDFENGDRGTNYPGKAHRVAHGIPFINAGHLSHGQIDFSAMEFISEERFALLSNGKIRPKDVLFCLRGSLGKFACVYDLGIGAIASSLVILRPHDTLLTDYLVAFLDSPQCREQIELRQGGAAQPNLAAKDLREFQLPLPGTEVQSDLASRLQALSAKSDRLQTLKSEKLIALAELERSLLHQAFTGQLTSKSADRQLSELA